MSSISKEKLGKWLTVGVVSGLGLFAIAKYSPDQIDPSKSVVVTGHKYVPAGYVDDWIISGTYYDEAFFLDIKQCGHPTYRLGTDQEGCITYTTEVTKAQYAMISNGDVIHIDHIE